jgi:REP element-mobilizing transposase RayT
MRMRGGLPHLRDAGVFAAVGAAIRGASASPAVGEAFRVIEFSVQDDHVHFIVEARDKDTLSRGLRGLAIRVARAFNHAVGIRGAVWGDRYHARDLKTPRAVRNALVYVLMNAKKHGARISKGVDRFSSARWFEGFVSAAISDEASPVVRARTWLARVGWRRHGRIALDERPRAPS